MGLCQANHRKALADKDRKNRVIKFDAKQLKHDLIDEINHVRALHQVPKLSLNKEIASISQSYANKLAKSENLDYSNNTYKGEELGEILFYYSTDCDAEIVIETWNKGSHNFRYNSKNAEASSFTQIVWKSSEYIGIGVSQNASGGTIIVANFHPGGNVVGHFAENVLPPKGSDAYKAAKKKEKEKKSENKEPSYTQQNLSGFSKFDIEALESHNKYRNKHHVSPLTLNKDLCKIATAYAKKLLSTNTFNHSTTKYKGKELGENLYMCSGKVGTAERATSEWYNEIKKHNFKKDFQHATGHFTQLVWKDTKEVGFGIANKGNRYYIVANYFPAGNIVGQFTKNVFKA